MAGSAQLQELNQQHRALERRIEEEQRRPSSDSNAIAELKRRKLRIKDEIARIEAVTRH
jgi:hypothetical protein